MSREYTVDRSSPAANEAQLGIVPVHLERSRITGDQVNSFRRYIETLARSQIYNRSVWTDNIDELAWSVLDLRVQETQVARDHPQGAELWHEKWPLDPQRLDMGHEKWYKWIRDNEYKYVRRLHKRDREEVGSGRSRADSRSDDDVGRAAKSSRTSTLSAVVPGAGYD